ncbi:MAG: Exocyst complex component 1, variant 2 [Marteilia pararefringens]
MDEFYAAEDKSILASAELDGNRILTLVSDNTKSRIQFDVLEKKRGKNFKKKKEHMLKNNIEIINYTPKSEDLKIYKIKINLSPPVEFFFKSFADKTLILNSIMMLTNNMAYKLKISMREEHFECDDSEILSKIRDFEKVVIKNKIDLNKCSNLTNYFNQQITELSMESVKDIFDSQKRIESLTDKISVSIDELNIVENKFKEYYSYMDGIKDLIDNIRSRSTEESSKSGNIKKLENCLQNLVIKTDLNINEFDVFLNMNLKEQSDLDKFNEIFDMLTKINLNKNDTLANIDILGDAIQQKLDITAKIVYKVAETIQNIMKEFFPDTRGFTSINNLSYSQMNNILSMFRQTILKINSMNEEYRTLIYNGYSELLCKIYTRNITDICLSISDNNEAGLELKYCESFHDLMQKSYNVYTNCDKALLNTFDISNDETRKLISLQIFAPPLSELVEYFKKFLNDPQSYFLLTCTLSIFSGKKYDENFWKHILLPLYQNLVRESRDKIIKIEEEISSAGEQDKSGKYDRDSLANSMNIVSNLVQTTNELFQKLPVQNSMFIDEIITLLIPAVLAHISDSISSNNVEISRYIRAAEYSSEIISLTQYKFSKKLLSMKSRASKVYTNAIRLATALNFSMHFDKLQDFFEQINDLVKNKVEVSSIEYRSFFKRELALKILKDYKPKTNRKLILKMVEIIIKNVRVEHPGLQKSLLSNIQKHSEEKLELYRDICMNCYSINIRFLPENQSELWNDASMK